MVCVLSLYYVSRHFYLTEMLNTIYLWKILILFTVHKKRIHGYKRIHNQTMYIFIQYEFIICISNQNTKKNHSIHSTMDSNSCALTSQTKNCNSSLTITCSSWNKRNINVKESNGHLSISAWICKPVLI